MTEIVLDKKSLELELKEAAEDIREIAQSISACGQNIALDECAKRLATVGKMIYKIAEN